jgi:outer membrane lipoprotein-sorting protein
MKKIIIYSLLFIGTVTHVFAQKDAEAKAILNQVSIKYRAYNVVKSDFTFVIDNPQAQETATQEGTIIVQSKTNKYKLSLYSQDPTTKTQVDQEIITDGKNQWTYTKKDKEVQLNKVDNSGDQSFNPAQMFTMYEKGYKYIYTGSETLKGRVYQIIDLTPEDIDKSFFKIRLMIDKVKKQIYSALIFDKSGNKYDYTIRTFTPNVQVPESTFTFDKKTHPGVEVVDLRQ